MKTLKTEMITWFRPDCIPDVNNNKVLIAYKIEIPGVFFAKEVIIAYYRNNYFWTTKEEYSESPINPADIISWCYFPEFFEGEE